MRIKRKCFKPVESVESVHIYFGEIKFTKLHEKMPRIIFP